ncbi:acyl-CoA thioesterase [Pisciglobus halotolerans]|nr:hotdog domain-containing protein [Pisciglobus halotolerans]
MNEEREVKFCRESRVIQTHRVFPTDLNMFGYLFGGKLMTMLDDTASISITRHCRRGAVTASVDHLDFLHPILENHSVCVETYVTGAGKKSIEVFAKVIGEVLVTGERYLAATCFMTFVAVPSHMNQETEFIVPLVQPETEEEKQVCAGYEKRKQRRMEKLKQNEDFAESLSLHVPWLGDD